MVLLAPLVPLVSMVLLVLLVSPVPLVHPHSSGSPSSSSSHGFLCSSGFSSSHGSLCTSGCSSSTSFPGSFYSLFLRFPCSSSSSSSLRFSGSPSSSSFPCSSGSCGSLIQFIIALIPPFPLVSSGSLGSPWFTSSSSS